MSAPSPGTHCARLLALALLVGLLAPAGNAARPAPAVSVTPHQIDFGLVAQGDSRSQTVSFTNTGKTAVLIGWGVEGIPFSYAGVPFTFADWNAATCPLIWRRGETGHGPFLMQGQTCTITVIAQTFNFPPGTIYYYPPGTYGGTFYVLVNEQRVAQVPLTVAVTP